MGIVLIKIVRFLEDALEPPLTYDEANKRLLLHVHRRRGARLVRRNVFTSFIYLFDKVTYHHFSYTTS